MGMVGTALAVHKFRDRTCHKTRRARVCPRKPGLLHQGEGGKVGTGLIPARKEAFLGVSSPGSWSDPVRGRDAVRGISTVPPLPKGDSHAKSSRGHCGGHLGCPSSHCSTGDGGQWTTATCSTTRTNRASGWDSLPGLQSPSFLERWKRPHETIRRPQRQHCKNHHGRQGLPPDIHQSRCWNL